MKYIKTIIIFLYLCKSFLIFDLNAFSSTYNDTIPLLNKAENCQADLALFSSVDSTAFTITVGIDSPDRTIIEGEQGIIRICREVCGGDLRVDLLLGGDAMLDSYYIIQGTDSFDDKWSTVTIPDGQIFFDIIVEAMDDVRAEADETITLTLQSGAGYTIDPNI